MGRTRRFVGRAAAALALSGLAIGGLATAPETNPIVQSQVQSAEAATHTVKVKNHKSSYTGAIVKQLKKGKVYGRGVTVEPGKKGSFKQKTGPGKDGCVLYMPAGAKARVFKDVGLTVTKYRQINNTGHYDKHFILEGGSCGGGTWNIRLIRGPRLLT